MREINTIDSKYKQINRETLVGWVVWYWIDGQGLIKYDSESHDWANLPKIGVQYLYRIYESGSKEQVSGCDYYCPYQLMEMEDIRSFIKFGLYLDDVTYQEQVVPLVLNDPINF